MIDLKLKRKINKKRIMAHSIMSTSPYYPNTLKLEYPDGFIVINNVLYDVWLHKDDKGVFRMEGVQSIQGYKVPTHIETEVAKYIKKEDTGSTQ